MSLSYDHELRPVLRGTTLTFHVRGARDNEGQLINFVGWTVRFLAKRWLDDSQPPLINGGTVAIVTTTSADNPNGWGALDLTVAPSSTAGLLTGVPTNEILLYWEIRATKDTVSIPLDSGTLPVVRSIEAAA